jgi:glycerol-3-phosphate dehydrogenase
MSADACDLLVIGGGINGCAIARDAAGRGLRVTLCDRGDLAGATSSATSKLIHGGLRYLEHGEFGLVREALRERALLLHTAPHLVRPLRLVLPHDASLRPRWMLRCGLFLYDRLGGARDVPRARALDLTCDPAGVPLREGLRHGFAFYDGWTDDARLVLALARDAAEHGATIRPRTEFLGAQRLPDGHWRARLRPPGGAETTLRARALANVGGPWVGEVAARIQATPPAARVRLVQGSHIVVPRWFDGEDGYLLQNLDRRVVFVLPWHGGHTLIGTTDEPLAGPPAEARVQPREIEYLCAAVGRWFRRAPQPGEIVDSFVGVRPLFDDGARDVTRVTRDRRLLRDADGAPLLHVFGGKLTTHRALAEEALEKLRGFFPRAGGPWTRAPLHGTGRGVPALITALQQQIPDLPELTARGLAERHGERAFEVVGAARRAADLGENFGAGLSAAEVIHAVRREWAASADDVLRRRTRCGFLLNAVARERVAALVRQARAGAPDGP